MVRLATSQLSIHLELLLTKCFPVLLYRLKCCQLNKADLQSLDFTSNRFFMKLFRTCSIYVVLQICRSYFGTKLTSYMIKKKARQVSLTLQLHGESVLSIL